MFRCVCPPLPAKTVIRPHGIDDFPAARNRLLTVSLLARRYKGSSEDAAMDHATSNAPELVNIVEVADARSRDVPRQDGLNFLGQHGLEWIGHNRRRALIEHERVLVRDGAGRNFIPCFHIDRERNSQWIVASAQEHPDAGVLVRFAKIVRVQQPIGKVASASIAQISPKTSATFE